MEEKQAEVLGQSRIVITKGVHGQVLRQRLLYGAPQRGGKRPLLASEVMPPWSKDRGTVDRRFHLYTGYLKWKGEKMIEEIDVVAANRRDASRLIRVIAGRDYKEGARLARIVQRINGTFFM